MLWDGLIRLQVNFYEGYDLYLPESCTLDLNRARERNDSMNILKKFLQRHDNKIPHGDPRSNCRTTAAQRKWGVHQQATTPFVPRYMAAHNHG